MTNEIKEIIKLGCEEEIEVKYFAKDNSLVNTYMDYSQLLDYITNLQEENKNYQNDYENLLILGLKQETHFNIKCDDLQQRIDKALEYIKEHTIHDTPKKLSNGIYERGGLIKTCDFYIEDLLDILRGDE